MDNAEAIVYGDNALRATTIADPTTGSTNDCVAVFTGADVNQGQGLLADWVTRDQSTEAVNGSSWTIIRRGIYEVVLTLSVAASVTVHAGIGIANTGAQLIANPTNADLQTRGVQQVTTPAATAVGLQAKATVGVTQSAAEGGTAIIRALLSNGSNTAPAAAALVLAQCTLEIRRISDLNSRA